MLSCIFWSFKCCTFDYYYKKDYVRKKERKKRGGHEKNYRAFELENLNKRELWELVTGQN